MGQLFALSFIATSLLAPGQWFHLPYPPERLVQLQIKFPPGRADRMVMDMTMKMKVAATGQPPTDMVMKQQMGMVSRVVSSTKSGASIKMTYEPVKTEMTMNGKKMPMPKENVKSPPMTFEFFPDGRIRKIVGIDAWRTRMKKDPKAAEMMPYMDQMLNEKAMKEMWDLSFGGMYPRRSLRMGESWKSSLSFGQPPFRMKMNLTLQLKGLVRRGTSELARMSIGGTGALDIAAAALGAPGATMKAEKFTVSGTSLFDLTRGWMSDQTMRMLVVGKMTMPRGGKTETARFSMDMFASSRVTPVK